MNNYCKHLKKRNNKPYCLYIKKEISLSLCYECANKEIKRKNAQYSKNIVQKSKKRRIIVSKETYNHVIERDKYSCRLCGSMQELQLHHIDGRGKYKTNDINNCIMLCRHCHLDVVHKNNKYWRQKLKEII